nr:MAG TPA: hypothetical protein [Caudoviricetes sp.]
MNFSVVRRAFSVAGLTLSKHAPAIFTGAGVIGFVGTAVLSSRATLKANDVMDPHIESLCRIADAESLGEAGRAEYTAEDANRDKITVYCRLGVNLAKLYAPAIGLGVLSTVLVTGGYRIQAKRLAGVTAAYGVVSKAYENYQKQVEDALGTDGKKQLEEKALGVAQKQIDAYKAENGSETPITDTHIDSLLSAYNVSQYGLVWDENCKNWEAHQDLALMILHAQQRYMNDVLRSKGYLLLNDVYKAVGAPETSAGAVVGWVYKGGDGDGYVSFGDFESRQYDEYHPRWGRNITRFVLDFNVDGVIWDMIDEVKVK